MGQLLQKVVVIHAGARIGQEDRQGRTMIAVKASMLRRHRIARNARKMTGRKGWYTPAQCSTLNALHMSGTTITTSARRTRAVRSQGRPSFQEIPNVL